MSSVRDGEDAGAVSFAFFRGAFDILIAARAEVNRADISTATSAFQ